MRCLVLGAILDSYARGKWDTSVSCGPGRRCYVLPVSDPETPVQVEPARWLLLVHQLPPKPGYPRVKVWRRLQALGAVAVRNAAYVLPAGEQAQEDFEWLLKEIGELGGEGMIWEARLVDGLSDEDVQGLFNTARAEDYDAVSKAARALAAALDTQGAPGRHGPGWPGCGLR